jgi:hypothetical protein
MGSASLKTSGNKADALVARQEEAFKHINHNRNIGAFWLSDDNGEMEALAKALAVVLLASVSNERTQIDIQHPSKHEALMAAIMTAIQALQSFKQSA